MATRPKLSIKNDPTPIAISHKTSNVMRVPNDMDCQLPKVLIRKWMKATMGIPITNIPEMDNNKVGTEDDVITDQSTNGILT